MKIDMMYEVEGKTLEEYKKDRIKSLEEILSYIKVRNAYVLKEQYQNKEIEISARKSYIYTCNEKERAINELERYIDFIKGIEITLYDDVWELGCKLYIFLRTQEKTVKCIKELGYRFGFKELTDEDFKRRELVLKKKGFKLQGEDLFYLIFNEMGKDSELGYIAYEIHMRNCYRRSSKGSWRSFEVIDYMIDNWDYRL